MGGDKDRGHILVVESEPDISYLLQEFLSGEGYEIEVLPYLDDLGDCDERGVDLVILDVSFGIREHHSNIESLLEARRIPTLEMSTDPRLFEAPSSKSNVAGFVSKPFDLEGLLQAVRSAIAAGRNLSNNPA